MSGPLALPPGTDGQDTLAPRLARPPRQGPSWARTDAEARSIGLRVVRDTADADVGEGRGRRSPDDAEPLCGSRTPPRGVDIVTTSGQQPVLRPARQDDPVDTLAVELADDVGAAVHPYEVAALLEAQGMGADRVRDTYGHPDLFSLADDLFRRVPRIHPEPPLPPDPWRPDPVRCALRGLLFALPGTGYLLAAGAWGDTAGLHGLVVAALVSWAWTQALSHRAYGQLAGGLRETALTLLAGAPLGAVVASMTGLAVAGPGSGALFAAAQSAYLAAAGVLLVLGRERLLGSALAPMAAGAATLLWWDPPSVLRVALPLLTVALTVTAATRTLRRALRAALRMTAGPAPDTPLVRSLPYGLFGLAAGTLTTLAGRQHPYSVVVLTLSMGPAEWLLHRYRGRAVTDLRASTTPWEFLLRATRTLLLCVAVYLVPLTAGAFAVGSPVPQLLSLGAVLWTALLLQAFGAAWFPAAITVTAAAAAFVLPTALCTAVAACLLLAVAARQLGSPTAHA